MAPVSHSAADGASVDCGPALWPLWWRAQGTSLTRDRLAELVGGLRIPLPVAVNYCGILPIRICDRARFEVVEDGEPTLIVGVLVDEVPVDLVAALSRHEWALLTGEGIFLGHDEVEAPDDPLWLWRTPLAWLQGGAVGTCVVGNWDDARVDLIGRDLATEDDAHAAELSARLTIRPRIVVRRQERLAA